MNWIRARRWFVVPAVGLLVVTAGRVVWSQAVMGPLDQIFMKEHVTMTVGAGIEKCERTVCRVTCAELEKIASEVKFPIALNFPADQANTPIVVALSQCQDFDSLACAVMALNDRTKTYPPAELLAIAGRCGRCTPDTVARLCSQYGH